jgi:brefeldin A-inhibited guanine nucleotide-exchange protein
MSSLKFVVSSLDAIAASKDVQRNKNLSDLVQKALAAIKEHDPHLPDPEIIFAPLQVATRSGSISLCTAALDCIGKLISYSYFSVPSATQPTEEGVQKAPLIDRAIDTICDCFQGETTPVEIQLQIVKSLLAAVLNDKIVVHGAGLLKAVRQVYNVFLLSRNTGNQQVAQGTLTQMVGTVFERVKTRLHMKEARMSLSRLRLSASNVTVDRPESANGVVPDRDGDDTPDGASVITASEAATEAAGKLTLKDLEHRKSFDDSQLVDGPTMVSQLKPAPRTTRSVSEQTLPDSPHDESPEALDAEDEVYIRDAYLVFRSFCNLSTKILPPDQLYDLRGQPMRSKLISLHLIHTLLNNNLTVFTSPLCTITNTKSNESTNFLQAIKYYLCLSITRNGTSSVDRVFEVCCDIFWLMLKFMRAPFKVSLVRVFDRVLPLTPIHRKKSRFS